MCLADVLAGPILVDDGGSHGGEEPGALRSWLCLLSPHTIEHMDLLVDIWVAESWEKAFCCRQCWGSRQSPRRSPNLCGLVGSEWDGLFCNAEWG